MNFLSKNEKSREKKEFSRFVFSQKISLATPTYYNKHNFCLKIFGKLLFVWKTSEKYIVKVEIQAKTTVYYLLIFFVDPQKNIEQAVILVIKGILLVKLHLSHFLCLPL